MDHYQCSGKYFLHDTQDDNLSKLFQSKVSELGKKIAAWKDQAIRHALTNGCPNCKRYQPIPAFVFVHGTSLQQDELGLIVRREKYEKRIATVDLVLKCEDCITRTDRKSLF